MTGESRAAPAPTAASAIVPRLPELIPIPAGAPAKQCACGARMWWVDNRGVRTPVACPPAIDTKTLGRLAVPTRAPTVTEAGVGINHHIDCAKRAQFGARAEKGDAGVVRGPSALTDGFNSEKSNPPGVSPRVLDADDVRTRIAAAELLASRAGVHCTGAPGMNIGERCGGFAVIAFIRDTWLAAAPCSAHADAVEAALRLDKRAAVVSRALDEYLTDRGDVVARRFALAVEAIRDSVASSGFDEALRLLAARRRDGAR